MRRLSALLVTILAAATLIVPLGAQAAPDPVVDTSAFCANIPPETDFTDIAGNFHEDNIICLEAGGVVDGFTNTRYGPREVVTRGQMASFIARAIDTANDLKIANLRELPSDDGGNAFSDVPSNSPHRAAINRLAAVGIARGGIFGGPTSIYAPSFPVSRAQMASFLARAYEYVTAESLRTDEDCFGDDSQSVHQININAICLAGIAVGQRPGVYGPNGGIQRDAMATFITRLFGVLEQNGFIRPLPPPGIIGDIAFRPQTTTELIDVDGAGADNQLDNQTYTARGLDPTARYRVTLVEDANITIAGEDATFTEDGTTGLAAAGDVGARIIRANGAAVATPGQSVGNIAPEGGQITVEIDAVSLGSQRPVIYTEGGTDTRLDIDDAGSPTDTYGVAGLLTTFPAIAPEGPLVNDHRVIFVDLARNFFVGQDVVTARQSTFFYDANDDFFLDGMIAPGDELGIVGFEARLSVNDLIDATSVYRQNPAATSTFVLIDEGAGPPDPPGPPGAPIIVEAAFPDPLVSAKVRLTFSEPVSLVGDAGQVFFQGAILGVLPLPILIAADGTSAVELDDRTIEVTLDLPVVQLPLIIPYDVTVPPGFVEDSDDNPNPAQTFAFNN